MVVKINYKILKVAIIDICLENKEQIEEILRQNSISYKLVNKFNEIDNKVNFLIVSDKYINENNEYLQNNFSKFISIIELKTILTGINFKNTFNSLPNVTQIDTSNLSSFKISLQSILSKSVIKLINKYFVSLSIRYKNPFEIEFLAPIVAEYFPDPERALMGVHELMMNAVEHGNLGISGEEKMAMIKNGNYIDEINKRLTSSNKVVLLTVNINNENVELVIEDEGAGFDWKNFIENNNIASQVYSGRGILLSKQLSFDNLTFNNRGNIVYATMNRSGGVSNV